ncbi:adenosine deaminase [Pilibacter termitis]|uniref:Adenosine deaminase n=1 Tax=Pilibacter termitis TaxID=263852 RepID=A0A1T4MI76_9ENTE|nr:adenosine deaminase [Pilibacter termitis]SJZ66662.1 adenosine deaminase [Pilibacter termitis]
MTISKQIIAQMPKIELHCHLDGSISLETIHKLAKMENIPLPATLEEQQALFIAPEETKDLNEYLEKFHFIGRLLQTTAALELAAFDVVKQASYDNVKYIEVRFAPTLHTMKGLTLQEIVSAVVKGLKRGEVEFGVLSNALLCGMRHEPVENAIEVAKVAKSQLTHGVVGFDLAGNEVDFPPYAFEEAIKVAKDLDIPLTLHAGECHCGKNVYDAVVLGANRIGHGIALKDTPEYIEYIKENEIVLELAPTSNFQTKTVTSWEEYPFKKFLDLGLKVTINTDNRTVSNTTLNKEYAKLAEVYDLTLKDFYKVSCNGVFGAFVDDEVKKELGEIVNEEFEKLNGH